VIRAAGNVTSANDEHAYSRWVATEACDVTVSLCSRLPPDPTRPALGIRVRFV
jgi:hypothetical protein